VITTPWVTHLRPSLQARTPGPLSSPFLLLLWHQCWWHQCGQRAAGIFQTACCPCPREYVQASTSRDGSGPVPESPAKVITCANLAPHLGTSHATGRVRAFKPWPVMPQKATRPAEASQQSSGPSLTARRGDSPRAHHSRPPPQKQPAIAQAPRSAKPCPGPTRHPPGDRIGARAELLLQNASRASGHHTRERETATAHVGAAASHKPRRTPRVAGLSLLQAQRRVKRKSGAIQERPVSWAGSREDWSRSWACGCSVP
jgi:hypothetical protein